MKNEKFTNLLQNTILYEGMVIKGYTYNIGDFYTTNKNKVGWPKLRVGIIVKKFSQNYVKVQFRNTAGLRSQNQSITNQILIFDKKNQKQLEILKGTNSYCMWIKRDSIKMYYKPDTIAIFDYDSIYQKHSKNKKDVEKKYFIKGMIAGLKPLVIKKILHEYQFTKIELALKPEIASLKIDLLIKKHYLPDYCVPKEYKKIIKARTFVKDDKNFPNLKVDFDNYIKNFDFDSCKI